jgi:hypothetical protein
MTDIVKMALIAAVPSTLVAIGNLITSLHNGDKITDVHRSLNSRLTQLVAASNAQGRQDERDSVVNTKRTSEP